MLSNAVKFTPDLAILDICMPEMDGFEVCKLIKEDLATMDIPVVMVTAFTDGGFEVECV